MAAATKICTRCGETKTLDEFHRLKRSKDGHHSWCKKCERAWNRSPARRARERARASARNKTPEFRAYRRAYDYARRQNPEVRTRDRARKQTPEFRAWNRARSKTPEGRALLRKIDATRRARKRDQQPDLTPEQSRHVRAIYRRAQYLRRTGRDIHVDHIVPVALGGCTIAWNLRILDAALNGSKSNRLPTDVELDEMRNLLLLLEGTAVDRDGVLAMVAAWNPTAAATVARLRAA